VATMIRSTEEKTMKKATAITCVVLGLLPNTLTQLGFLRREFGREALLEGICGTEDVIEERKRRFIPGGDARRFGRAGRLLVELPALCDGNVSSASPPLPPGRLISARCVGTR